MIYKKCPAFDHGITLLSDLLSMVTNLVSLQKFQQLQEKGKKVHMRIFSKAGYCSPFGEEDYLHIAQYLYRTLLSMFKVVLLQCQ